MPVVSVQFCKDLIVGKIVHEVQLNNEDHLQLVKIEFSSNTTGPFNVVSMEYNMVEAIEDWENKVLTHLPTFTISDHSNALEKLQYDIVKWICENNGEW
ncbi:526_t:CDS:2, partial [Dentiscutata heterogama]